MLSSFDNLKIIFKLSINLVNIEGVNNMSWGLRNRLDRVLPGLPNGTGSVMFAIDHGYFMGPTSGLENPRETIVPLLPHADSLMLSRGILQNSIPKRTNIPIVLRVSSGNSILNEDLSNEKLCVSIEDAIRLNVSAVAFSIYIGGAYEHQTIVEFSKLVNDAHSFGIPVLAVTAVGKDMNRDLRYLSLASRIAVELGADIVKTYYCEGFSDLIAACPVPVVIAGGKKVPELEALKFARNAVSDGAAGVDMGRNIFQSDSPENMIQAVRSVVVQGVDPKKAYEQYQRSL
ncbi:MAG TPA: 3-hydroxy-5-phosphonooxypentane-2,4-dione thiolase [Candidatus Marinimicrobia bacterium]|nr:3-hydroxy-5-phosphonooxypentane-2,4-dione thiolase [Candidatus Neomarinimicrobiota bacterium]